MSDVELIAVAKGADYLEVHPTTLAGHKAVGWVECERREPAVDEKKAQWTVGEIKAALADKNIAIPDGVTLKADLQALLDAQA
jgi:hypothetical protein